MDEKELLIEIDRFLNEFGYYEELLVWAENYGFNRNDFEADYEKAVQEEY